MNLNRFGAIGEPLEDISCLLIGSIHKTHQDVLKFPRLNVDHSLGLKVATGEFVHLPTGKKYLVAVTQIPEAG